MEPWKLNCSSKAFPSQIECKHFAAAKRCRKILGDMLRLAGSWLGLSLFTTYPSDYCGASFCKCAALRLHPHVRRGPFHCPLFIRGSLCATCEHRYLGKRSNSHAMNLLRQMRHACRGKPTGTILWCLPVPTHNLSAPWTWKYAVATQWHRCWRPTHLIAGAW
jgi:hypothetical protein